MPIIRDDGDFLDAYFDAEGEDFPGASAGAGQRRWQATQEKLAETPELAPARPHPELD